MRERCFQSKKIKGQEALKNYFKKYLKNFKKLLTENFLFDILKP
jgi:hypothetical protein